MGDRGTQEAIARDRPKNMAVAILVRTGEFL